MKAGVYDWMYRTWAPWDDDTVRQDLLSLIDSGRVSRQTHPRVIDLGCGTGTNVVHLASLGYDAYGVDFSEVAITRARQKAASAGVEATFVVGDLTASDIQHVDGPFDLLLDFGTLDDLRGGGRRAMAATVTRLSRPGSVFLEYCFFGRRQDLPRFSFRGASRLSHIAPGELESLFGDFWEVGDYASYQSYGTAAFLLTRRPS